MEGQINNLQPIGLIGLGHMGLPIAQRLKAAGCCVYVYRRRATAAMGQWLDDGGEVVDTLAGLHGCRSVILSLPATDDVRGVAKQLVEVLQPGALIIDTSTIHPSGAREFAVLARGHGLGWLDAPISGGPSGAAAGTLAVMVGGQGADFDRAMPLFEIIGKTIVHFGDSGCGVINKLANNTLLAVSAVATCEILTLVGKAGLNQRTSLDVISAGSGYNRFMDTRGKILAQYGVYEPPAFTVNMLLKDLRIAMDASAEIGFTPTVLRTALAAFECAVGLGLGEQDFSNVLRVPELDAGVART